MCSEASTASQKSDKDAEEEESEDDAEGEAEDENPPKDAASGDLDDITAGLAAASISK